VVQATNGNRHACVNTGTGASIQRDGIQRAFYAAVN
jgi:hypothetical protein